MADNLTEDQQSALAQYLAVTQQDTEAAIAVLQRSEWNVQIAITKFFDGDADPTPPSPPASSSVPSASSSAPLPPPTNLTPAPRITVPQDSTTIIRRPPLIISIFFLPFSLLYRLLSGSFSLFAYLFPFLRPTIARSLSTGAGRKVLNPRDRAERYIRDFEECVRGGGESAGETSDSAPSPLPWYRGGYAQALDLAKNDVRFLLVVLTSDEHEDTTTFFRRTLANPELATFLNTENFVLWGGRVDDSEGYQVSKALEVTLLPVSLLISVTPPNTRSSVSGGMSVIARLQGDLAPESYLSKLRNSYTAHLPHLEAIRRRKREQEEARRITQNSMSAYERSLAADRARAEQRRKEREEAERREREAREEAERIEMVELKKSVWKRAIAKEVAEVMREPEKGGVRLQIRVGDERIVRRVKDDVSLENLYRFIECKDEVRKVESGEETDEVQLPENYTHEFKFRIATMLPKKVYEPGLSATVGELFAPSASLVVEEEDEEGEESDDE